MVAFRNLTAENDMTFGKGLNNYARDNQAVGLDIKTRIQSWLNDCFFDLTAGIDWPNRLGQYQTRDLLDQDVKNIILKTPEVRGIKSFSTDVINRVFVAQYTVITTFSQEFSDLVEVSRA